jgi:hypothetical protein
LCPSKGSGALRQEPIKYKIPGKPGGRRKEEEERRREERREERGRGEREGESNTPTRRRR